MKLFLHFSFFILVQFISFFTYGNQLYANSSFNAEEQEDSTMMSEDIFLIDDSLLRIHHPEVAIKPTYTYKTPRVFTHTLEFQYTRKNNRMSNYLIITTLDLFRNLGNEIKTYAEDVHAIYGYGVYVETTSNATPEQLKSLILNYKEDLCGVFFIGNLGECMYEISNDHNKYGYRQWPCDLFFMDLDGEWIDTDGNGIYDQHTGNIAPDIFFGRLSAVGLESLGDEEDLIRTQLKKSHDFWWKSSFHGADRVLNYIDNDWNKSFLPGSISAIFASNEVDDIRYIYNSTHTFSPTDYLARLSKNEYGFTHLAAHSSPTQHQFTNGYVFLSGIKKNAAQTSNYAYNLFCCSACNWTIASTQGYLGGVYLFNNGKTLSVVGSTKTGGMLGSTYFYSYLSMRNIGQSLLDWWKTYYGNSHNNYTISWSYGMTILGDPTIRLRHKVSDYCERDLFLDTFPVDNISNLIIYKAERSIHITDSFHIPNGVHVIFDAPQILFEPNFTCPLGASFETRYEGCEL